MSEGWTQTALSAVMLAACWPAWWAAGWLIEQAGLFQFDLLGRVCLLFLFLGLAGEGIERLLARRAGQPGH